ncbi:MAG: hypothetical protein J1E81_06530 [Eubacterium sp.]|nr:hypothetical protein [Eubacterium sp.]
MKSIKKILCVFLSFILIALYGCSMLEQKSGFIKMENLIFNKYEYVISVDIKDDTALIFTSFSNDDENYQHRIIIYNLRFNKLINQTTMNDEKLSLSEFSAELTDDESFALCDVWEKKADIYNYDFEVIQDGIDFNTSKIYDYSEYYSEKIEANSLIEDTFVTQESFAYDILGDNKILVFYDDSNNFYVQSYSENESIITSSGRKIFVCNESRDSLKFEIRDYSSSMITNTAEILLEEPTDEDMTRIPYIDDVSEKYLVAPIVSNEGSLESIYYWNYTINQSEQPFDDGKINYNSIDKCINNAEENLENSYEIDVVLNPDTIDEDKPLIPEKNKLILYLSLLYLNETFEQFPKGMFKEIYDYEDGFDSLCIYLCNYIDDNFSDAYAANMNGVNYIVYSTRSLSKSNIAHELLHAMEYRIWKVCGEKYDIQWEKLNPPDFEYVGYDDYNNYNEYDEVEKYFARDYGRATNLEDRAVTFEYLFSYGCNNIFLDWEKDSPVYKKAELICTSLKEAYPSIKNSDNIIWEKYLTE